MATDFVETKAKGGRSGANHARYIAGEGRYEDKNEVVFSKDFNIHKDAINAVQFFAAADNNEAQARSGKARSYRDLMIALPHELGTKEAAIEYSEAIAAEVCGKEHAGRLGVHLKEGNWHLHLMFSERRTRNDLPLAENFARGKNNKVRGFVSDKWLDEVKRRNLAKILKLCPDFKPPRRGEEKIGPKLKSAGASYETGRSAREERVHKLRADEKALASINDQIAEFKNPRSTGGKVEQEKTRSSALERILSRPKPEPKQAVVFSGKTQARIQIMRERSQDMSIGKNEGKSRFDNQEQSSIASQAKATTDKVQKEMERSRREAAYEAQHAAKDSKSQQDAEFRRIWLKPKGM